MSGTIRTQATSSVQWNNTSNSTANRFLNEAMNYVKAAPPYVFGGGHGGPQQGYGSVDCSGMVIQSLYKAGVKNPENLVNTSSMPGQSISRDQLKPGDLLYKHGSGDGGHVAIYIGNGMIAESYQTGLPPRVRKLGDPDEFTDYRRIFDQSGDAVNTAGVNVAPASGGSGGAGPADSVAGNIASSGKPSGMSLPSGGMGFHDYVSDENKRDGDGGDNVSASGGGSGAPAGGASGANAAAAGAPVGPPPSGDVKQWIDQAIQILEAPPYNIPASALDPNDIATIIQHESGGDPHAINLTDSNAAAGTPSKGLMQTIDSTFNQYAAQGHNDIYNPVDNIIAGVRYAIDRYGSLGNVPGIKSVAGGGAYVGY